MKIAITGYGKMGKEIEKIAVARGMTVQSIIDPAEKNAAYREITGESMKNVDVCIDFSTPASVMENIRKAAKHGCNIVVGTTGWYGSIEEVKKIVKESKIGLIYAANFSIGVNVFFRIVENASKMMDKIDAYDVFGYELHHNKKLDSPSGTAKTLAETVVKSMKRKNKIVYDIVDRKIEPNELHFASVRSGSIPGTHVVGFDSSADTIELKHTARNREGFALGAVMAAEWVKGKKGFFGIKDMMDSIIKV